MRTSEKTGTILTYTTTCTTRDRGRLCYRRQLAGRRREQTGGRWLLTV
nr:MAG TPA: hypothetical protein [Caudoviricetes sp.]